MEYIPCLLIDDDPEEHEIFMMAMEPQFDCSACFYATDIFGAINNFQEGLMAEPEAILIDWSVIRVDPVANLGLLRSAFPSAADRIYLLSGEIPLVDVERLGICGVIRKQASIDAYALAIGRALRSQPQAAHSNF